MPITLACPSCTKRFRARDESAGKRVKCPFCQAAVTVPAGDDGPAAAEPAAPPSPLFAPPPAPAAGPGTVQFQSPSDDDPAPAPALFDVVGKPARPAPVPPPERAEPLFGVSDPPPKPAAPKKKIVLEEPAKPGKAGKAARPAKPAKPAAAPEEVSVASWRKAKGGLGWVQFGLFLFLLVGFVPFGRLVYEQAQQTSLPTGDGAEWVKVDGYINSAGPDAVSLSKTELLDLAMFAAPVLLGGLAVVYGRLTAGAVPRTTGAKGLFLFSGLLTLVALAGAGTVVAGEKGGFGQTVGYGWLAVYVGGALAEFWFLLGLGAVAGTLRRPRAVRAVGRYAFVLGLAAVVVVVGWEQYVKLAPEQLGRPAWPAPLDADWKLYEAGAKMLGWLLVIGSYWRAVSAVKGGMKDQMRALREAGGEG